MYIMYFITENEAPPPNVPLSRPPHQLSKSLLKVMTLPCRFYAQSDDIIAKCLSTRLLIFQCKLEFQVGSPFYTQNSMKRGHRL